MSKLPPTPATEADYRAGVAACLAMMLPEAREATRTYLNTETVQKAIKWKSKTSPNLTDKQLAAEAAKQSAAKAGTHPPSAK